MKIKIITFLLGLIVCGFCIYAIYNVKAQNVPVETQCIASLQRPEQEEQQIQVICDHVLTAPPLSDDIDFCGEKVPLNLYWVNEGLDRELITQYYQHSRTLLALKRSARFFPIIEKILKEEKVPEDLKYLCIAESNLENVVSPAKASGFWQFMEGTGKNYGLEINENVDERYHLEKATYAASQYLKKLKKQFGSWSLAAAAYNMGESGLAKEMKEQQVENYWELFLNQETSRYVSRCIAYKLIFENQELYNIRILDSGLYKPIDYKEIVIDKSIDDLRVFCTENKILYRQLKELNPWLRSTKLPVKTGSSYTLRVAK